MDIFIAPGSREDALYIQNSYSYYEENRQDLSEEKKKGRQAAIVCHYVSVS